MQLTTRRAPKNVTSSSSLRSIFLSDREATSLSFSQLPSPRASILRSHSATSSKFSRLCTPLSTSSPRLSRYHTSFISRIDAQSQRQYATAQKTAQGAISVNEKDFKVKVMDASHQAPVILDCYADWCAPCKKLTPMLEKDCQKLGFTLAKLNVDLNPNVTKQLQVASLPTVFAIYKGQLVGNFVGAVGEADLKKWFDDVVATKKEVDGAAEAEGNKEEDGLALLEEAKQALAQGDIPTASQKYSDALNMDLPKVAPQALAGLALCAIGEGNLEAAQTVVKTLKMQYPKDLHLPEIARAISTVELRVEFAKNQGGDAETDPKKIQAQQTELRQKLKGNPNDHQARYDLAFSLFSVGQVEPAIDEVLELIKRDKHWNDEAARKLLLKIFDALGPTSDLTKKTRQRFASVWFC